MNDAPFALKTTRQEIMAALTAGATALRKQASAAQLEANTDQANRLRQQAETLAGLAEEIAQVDAQRRRAPIITNDIITPDEAHT